MMGRVVAMNDRLAELRKAEQELKVIFEDDEKDVRESKAKVEKAKKDV